MNKAIDEARVIVKRLGEKYHPEKIILFGSVVRGNVDSNSDIDLLVVKKSDKKRPFRVKEIFEALRGLKRDYPLDAIVYTPTEIAARLSLGDYFIKNVLKEGRVVYG